MRNPDRGARLRFTELPSSSDEYSVFALVFVGILQRGHKPSPADPQQKVIGVPFCGFAEVLRVLDVRNTEADFQNLVEPHYSHYDFVSIGK